MKKYCWLLSFILPLSSFQCGMDKDVSFYVQNDDTQKIYLYATDSFLSDSVLSGERKLVTWDDHMPSDHFYKGYANVGIVKVTNGSSVCNKDITAEANWNLTEVGEKKYEYVFTVGAHDF